MKHSSRGSISRAVKLLLFFLILACILPVVLKDKDGKSFLSVDKIKLPSFNLPEFDLPGIPFFSGKSTKKKDSPVKTELLSPDVSVPDPDQPVVKIYKFRDEKGVLHFTDKKPDRGDYEVMLLPVSKEDKEGHLDKIKGKLSELKKKAASVSSGGIDNEPGEKKKGFTLPYSDAGKVIRDAKDVRKQVEETYEKQGEMIEEMGR